MTIIAVWRVSMVTVLWFLVRGYPPNCWLPSLIHETLSVQSRTPSIPLSVCVAKKRALLIIVDISCAVPPQVRFRLGKENCTLFGTLDAQNNCLKFVNHSFILYNSGENLLLKKTFFYWKKIFNNLFLNMSCAIQVIYFYSRNKK